MTQTIPLLETIVTAAVVADKAYDADAVLQRIAQAGAAAVIPPRANRIGQRAFDTHQYPHRNLIERCFCRLKQFRRIAARYDKLASRFSAFIALVTAFIWLA